MAYEIDFVGVSADKAEKDAGAICLRWKCGTDIYGQDCYKVGVVDGGFEAHGNAMVDHMNKYYYGGKDTEDKVIDFMVVTHPHLDHVLGLKKILESFTVRKIYMNRPWLYADELWDKVNDGRITKQSLRQRLHEAYKAISDIEEIAEDQGIPIYEAFQGTYIEEGILILSPPKTFYLDLLVEADKTPLQESAALQLDGVFGKIVSKTKSLVLSKLEDWNIETLREGETTTADNETSVVIRGIIDDSGFLLTGDAGTRALNLAINYMETVCEDIIEEISFYQIPHHGGRHNVSPSLLDRMVGSIVKKGTTRGKTAFASVAEGSDHPRKMVTNAFIRRGVRTCKTSGTVISYKAGSMPNRGWAPLEEIEFSDYVEAWEK